MLCPPNTSIIIVGQVFGCIQYRFDARLAETIQPMLASYACFLMSFAACFKL